MIIRNTIILLCLLILSSHRQVGFSPVPSSDMGLIHFLTTGYERVSISSDGGRALISLRGMLFEINLSSGSVNELEGARLSSAEIAYSGTYSPDGRNVLYSLARSALDGAKLYILSLETGERKELMKAQNEKAHYYNPTFSGDGKKIVFMKAKKRIYSMFLYQWSEADIYTINTDGTGEKRITCKNYFLPVLNLSNPSFSGDGRNILFSAFLPELRATEIFLVSEEKCHQPRQLIKLFNGIGRLNTYEFPSSNFSPIFTPDGKKFLFLRSIGLFYPERELWRAENNGSNLELLYRSKFAIYSPVVSPDGEKIYFLSETEDFNSRVSHFSLWMLSKQGKNPQMIAKVTEIGFFHIHS